jgi:hypothetical protein
MTRVNGTNIQKGENFVVFVNDMSGELLRNNVAEDTISPLS